MPPACHSLPRRRFATLEGAALRGKTSSLAQRQNRTYLAPLLGELSRQRLRGRQSGVWSRGEKTERSQTNLSLRGAKRRGNPHPLYAMRKCTAAQKKKRIPTTSDVGHWSRNDSVFLNSALPFPKWHSLHPGDPFGTSCHCLAAARSRRGSDMPPACHSLPRRRFATLEGAALRGKTSSLAQRQRRTLLAPLLWELSRQRLRGRQSWIIANRQKKERSKNQILGSLV